MANSRLFGLLRSVFAHRYLAIGLVLLAALIYLPTLGSGWVADDLFHRAKLLDSLPFGGKGATSPHPHKLSSALMDLFVWASSDNDIRPFMDFGSIPWWTFEGLRLSFWRPLAALTHWIDYKLWPDSAPLMHAHSLLWFVLVIALVTFTYRRLMAFNWVAGLAALLFTMDDLHYGTVSWLASRYVLPTFFFGLLAILAHDRWRREGLRAQGILSSIWLILALLSGEAGLAAVAYLAAYALFLDRGSWRKRLLSLIPSFTVVAAWRIIYRYLGYGVSGTGLYLDPTLDPLGFVTGIIERGPILLLGLLGEPNPARYTALSPTGSYYLWLCAILFLGAVFLLLLPLFRRDRVACFWAAGMVLCIVPASASHWFSGRLAFFAALGGMGLVAQLIAGTLDRHNWVPAGKILRGSIWALCILLMGLHLVVPPWHAFKRTRKAVYVTTRFERQPQPFLPTNIQGHDIVIINHPNPSGLFYLPYYSTLLGQPLPAHIRVLFPGFSAVEVTRKDKVTLVVRSECGFLSPSDCPPRNKSGRFPLMNPVYHHQFMNLAFRDRNHPLKLGESIELSGVRIEVTKLSKDGYPLGATFRFERPLEDPSMKWLKWDWESKAFTSFSPPLAGSTMRVPGPFD